MASAPAPQKPKGWQLFKLALQTRKSATMLGFGFSSGLPFALLIGTLNAWLGEVKIDLATIGVLSWIGLTYSFKFLWSPLVDRLALPGLERLGRRKSWIALCQGVLVASFMGLAATDPTRSMGSFALFAFLGALASATQDVAIDAWRIDVADEQTSVELLTSIGQFSYRIASIVGGALALVMAGRMSWPLVYLLMAGLIALIIVVTLRAPDTPRVGQGALHAALSQPGELVPKARGLALLVVGLSWTWAIVTIVVFMVQMLRPLAPGAKHPSVAAFTRETGPWIVLATVGVPLLVSAVVNALKVRGQAVLVAPDDAHGPGRTALNHLYVALVSPLSELVGRLRWGVLIVIGMILTYPLCYNMWASFAFPFYLDFLHYSKDEVAFASKLFGIFMSMAGVGLGGFLFVRVGRMPTILLGVALPILGNFVYADLAEGGAMIDRVAHGVGLQALLGAFGFDDRMVRLLLTIGFENISTGIAGAAFVAYISTIVSRSYTAVQYALLSSLTFLIGSLGRGIAGEAFDLYGYATVFRYAAAAGGLAVVFVLLEWVRVSRLAAHHPPTPSSSEEGEVKR